MPPQVRPENALQRAADLIAVGKEQDALMTLHDCVKRRPRVIWAPVHHDIMMRHVELAVKLRQPQTAKDALWQYRNIVQQINVKSLDDVIMHFLKLAEARVESARNESKDIVEEIDDLEQAESPESMMLSAVTSAGAQDRTDRLVLAPWLRFLWDSYRNCLDLLRNNAQVERLYHEIARRAYKFCITYNRRTEFRKLCDSLRTHLNQIQKNQTYTHGVKLNSNETLGMMQETRLAQLETALKMEMWTEAYKSSEDVFNIFKLSVSKDARMLQPKMLTAFYDKLAKVFLMSDNHLYHAAAQCKTFEMYKEQNKKFSAEDRQARATRCVLSVLSVGTWSETASDLARYLDMEETWSANQKQLAHLLDLSITPTKQSLVRELLRLGCVDVASDEAKLLFKYLEEDFSPLRLCANVESTLSQFKTDDLTVYSDAIRRTAATRALKQCSQVYQSISMPRLRKVLPYYEGVQLEYFVVGCIKKTYIKGHIDHRDDAIVFSGKPSDTTDELTADGCIADDDLNDDLEAFYTCIQAAKHKLDEQTLREDAQKMLAEQVRKYAFHAEQDYARMNNRKHIIESYKEAREVKKTEDKQRETHLKQRQERERQMKEQAELKIQHAEMEKQRKIQKQLDFKQAILDQKIMELRQSAIGQKVLAQLSEEQIARTNVTELIAHEQSKLAEVRQAAIDKQRSSEKKWDYYVRAAHGEEVAARKQWLSQWKHAEIEEWKRHEQNKIDMDKADYEKRAANFALASKIESDAAALLKTRSGESREEKLDALHAKWEADRAAELQRRLEKIADERYLVEEYRWKQEMDHKRKQAEEMAIADAMLEQKRENEERRNKRQAEFNAARGITDTDAPSRADASNDWRGDRTQQVMRGPANPGQADSATDWRRGDSKPMTGGGGPPSSERQAMLATARDFTGGSTGGYRPPQARGETPQGGDHAPPTRGAYVPPSQRAAQQQQTGPGGRPVNRPTTEAPAGAWR